MRIAFVDEWVAPKGMPFFGGPNARLINLAKHLTKENDIHIITSFIDGGESLENYDDIEIHRIGRKRIFTQKGDFREIGRLVSDDRIALEYLWKKKGTTICPHYRSSDFYFVERGQVQYKNAGGISGHSGNEILPFPNLSLQVALFDQIIRIIRFREESFPGRASELQDHFTSL